MKTKICSNSKCKQPEKLLSEFSKDKSKKDGLRCYCKECAKLAQKEYYEKYPLKRILQNIKQRCNNPKNNKYYCYGKKGIKCLITEEELKQLWFRDQVYNMVKPSIDRENKNKDYNVENCQFIELVENSVKDKRKIILQYDLQGNFIEEFQNIFEIQKILKINHGNMSQCCNGKRLTCGGFKWKYKNE